MNIAGHYHYDCPICSEEAIRERCPAFRMEWMTTDNYVGVDMVRLWYKDGTYMDVDRRYAQEYECDPEWDRTEELEVENGCTH